MPELDQRIKASIVECVLSGSSVEDHCDIFSFESDGGRKHYQAVARCKAGVNAACFFTLPTSGQNVYVTMSDGDLLVVRRVLAAFEEAEAEGTVRLGNVLLLDASELRDRGLVGAILLPPSVSNMLHDLPLTKTVCGRLYSFLLVTFLSEREHAVWKEQGHDALMELFASDEKDLVAFGAGNK